MTNSNSKVVPEAKEALNKFKHEVHVLQGEREMTAYNKTLGKM